MGVYGPGVDGLVAFVVVAVDGFVVHMLIQDTWNGVRSTVYSAYKVGSRDLGNVSDRTSFGSDRQKHLA